MEDESSCPICHAQVKCDVDAVTQCRCGASLLVLDAQQCEEVPVYCRHCGETYLAEPEDIGQQLECGCGQLVVVPDRVLVPPVRADTLFQDAQTETSPQNKVEDQDTSPPRPSSGKGFFLWGVLAATPIAVGLTMFFTRSPSPSTDAQPAALERDFAMRSQEARLQETVPSPENVESNRKALLDLRRQSIELWTQQTTESSASTGSSSQPEEKPDLISPFGTKTKPRIVVLPETRQPRRRVAPQPPERKTRSFEIALQEALKQYDAYLKTENENSSGSPTAAQDSQLAKALGHVTHAQQLATKESAEELAQLNYLLAYLHYQAGNLIRSSIFGEAAARWGKMDDEFTHDAAMISMAAAEEANAIGWGDPEVPGELARIESIAVVIQSRWPKDAQLATIQWTLANRYDWYGLNQKARQAFLKISGDHAKSASFRAARSLWYQFLDKASGPSPDADSMVNLLQKIDSELQQAVKQFTKDDPAKHALELMEARSLLSRIASRLGNDSDAQNWLFETPFALIPSSAKGEDPADSEPKKQPANELRQRLLPQSLLTLIESQLALGQWSDAWKSILDFEASTSNASPEAIAGLQWKCIRGLFDQLTNSQSLTPKSLITTRQLLESIDLDDETLSTAKLVWISRQVDQLADQAQKKPSIQKELKQWALAQPARFSEAINRRDDVSDSARQSVRLKLIAQRQRLGDTEGALEELLQILAETPNAISLQFDAALLLEQLAIETEQNDDLKTAIEGDGVAWGWAKLFRVCQTNANLKDASQQSSNDLNRPLMAATHYHLCRLLRSPNDKASAQRQLRQLILTADKSSMDRANLMQKMLDLTR